jgi:transposase
MAAQRRREKRSSIVLNAIGGMSAKAAMRKGTSSASKPSTWRWRGENKYTVTFQHPGAMDRQTLSNSLSNISAVTVAAIFGVTRRTIYRWCKKYDVPRRVYGCPDRELLCRLEADCIFQKHIAMTFGVSRWTIRLWCKKYAIAHHTTGQFRKGSNRNNPAIHEEMPFGIGVLFGDDFD